MKKDKINVLLVGDDKNDYLVTKNLLSKVRGFEFNLEWVSTYPDALEVIGRNNHHIFLFDYQLGECTGIELLREVIGNGCRVPIILLTGQGEDGIDVEAMRAGAADFLVKGKIDATLLERSIRYAIERRHAEEQISRMAYYDYLTSLPNRLLFCDRLQHAIAQAERNQTIAALLFLDLDNFKRINDTLGHRVGDLLLKEVASRLISCMRKTDIICRQKIDDSAATIARLGGDEFTVLLYEIKHFQDAAKVAKRILDVLSVPFAVGDHEIFVTTSVGIALFPLDGKDIDTLLKNADTAMYHAKSQGRNNYQFYKQSMNAAAFERLSLEYNLHKALDRDELLLYYQPQMDLRTGEIVGMEALLRWQHPEIGMVTPGEFIPMAEETGLIVPIGEWVLHAACKQNKLWQEAGFKPIRVAVNLSTKQFKQRNLTKIIADALEKSGLAPQYLDLEITESLMMQNTQTVISMLNEIKEMGLCFSIDDFGTGFSSFSYLKRLPIDTLKIDRSFIKEITVNPDDAAIVTAILAMARSLKLKVTAEGVETEEQLAFLNELGCDEVQGYLLSRPLPPDEVLRFLTEANRG